MGEVVGEFSLTVKVCEMMQLSSPVGVIMGISRPQLLHCLPRNTEQASSNARKG